MLTRLDPRSLSVSEKAILGASLFQPTQERIRLVLETVYYDDPQTSLFCIHVDGQTAAIAGIRRDRGTSAELLHIAVDPQLRKQGLGRQLVYLVLRAQGLSRLTAETDHDAVGFYERCGFRVESLGERYPGVQRYRCIL